MVTLYHVYLLPYRRWFKCLKDRRLDLTILSKIIPFSTSTKRTRLLLINAKIIGKKQITVRSINVGHSVNYVFGVFNVQSDHCQICNLSHYVQFGMFLVTLVSLAQVIPD